MDTLTHNINGNTVKFHENFISVSVDNSSVLKLLLYYPEDEQLTVFFKNGGHYWYSKVAFRSLLEVLTAESVGKAFNSVIKGNHEYEKV